MNAQAITDFETGSDSEPVDITIRGKTQRYLLNDISAQTSDSIYKDIILGNEKEKKVAQSVFRNKIIASVVTRADGSPISVEDAAAMRSVLANKLLAAALTFINPGEDDGKNDSAETSSGDS